MFSAFLIALREGVEASLVVGIILVYLSRTSRASLARFVWYGVAAATALSLGVAIALERWRISQDGFEGLMLMIASVFVITMIVWMNRVARHLKKEIEQKVESYATRTGNAAGWGIFLFVFLMVLREGAELALILRAVELSSEGLRIWIGTATGIAGAVAVGLFFFKGTLRVPLHRFFAATSVILMLVAFQLALTGLHEMSEAGWLPSSKAEMALIGPIVRNELFFFVFIFGAAALLVLREWQSASHAAAMKHADSEAEKRLLEAQNRRQRSWIIAAAGACLVVILVLTADFIYTRANSAPPSAQPITAVGNQVRIPLTQLQDATLHLFTINLGGTVGGQAPRFMVIKKPNGYGTALDACRICGAEGYRQDGQNVVCRHCGSAIYVPSVGDQGGCNPIGVSSHIEGGDLVLDISALTQAVREVPQ
ncbi:MAG TPA: Fe-S-containing protein [Candidatus Dormibacteraeota bacterium]|nr:Fe-S-containing protein [Candidatus Dormibacteraeota bacterium]